MNKNVENQHFTTEIFSNKRAVTRQLSVTKLGQSDFEPLLRWQRLTFPLTCLASYHSEIVPQTGAIAELKVDCRRPTERMRGHRAAQCQHLFELHGLQGQTVAPQN